MEKEIKNIKATLLTTDYTVKNEKQKNNMYNCLFCCQIGKKYWLRQKQINT